MLWNLHGLKQQEIKNTTYLKRKFIAFYEAYNTCTDKLSQQLATFFCFQISLSVSGINQAKLKPLLSLENTFLVTQGMFFFQKLQISNVQAYQKRRQERKVSQNTRTHTPTELTGWDDFV